MDGLSRIGVLVFPGLKELPSRNENLLLSPKIRVSLLENNDPNKLWKIFFAGELEIVWSTEGLGGIVSALLWESRSDF